MQSGSCTLISLNVTTLNTKNQTTVNYNVTGEITKNGEPINTTPELDRRYVRNNTDANYIVRGRQFISTVPTGTAPFSPTSTTLNTNLNADLWDGYHADQSTTTTADVTHNSVNVAQTGSYKINSINILSKADIQHFTMDDFIYGDSSTNKLGIGITEPLFSLHVGGSGDTGIASFAGHSYGGGTIILRALDAMAWSGLNIYDENDEISASFQYGNTDTSVFTNELVFAGRKDTTDVSFWTSFEGTLYRRLAIDAVTGYTAIGEIADSYTPLATLDVLGSIKASNTISLNGLMNMTYNENSNSAIFRGKGNTSYHFMNGTGNTYAEIHVDRIIEHTSWFNESLGDGLDNVHTIEYYKNSDGTYNKSKSPCVTYTPIQDFSRPFNVYTNEVINLKKGERLGGKGEIFKNVLLNNKTVTILTRRIDASELINITKINDTAYSFTSVKIDYPWIIQEGIDQNCMTDILEQAQAEVHSGLDIVQYDNIPTPSVETKAVVSEAYYTKSKTANKTEKYISKILKNDIYNKSNHYALVNATLNGNVTPLLDVEERLVQAEGTLKEVLTILCERNVLKKADGCP